MPTLTFTFFTDARDFGREHLVAIPRDAILSFTTMRDVVTKRASTACRECVVDIDGEQLGRWFRHAAGEPWQLA